MEIPLFYSRKKKISEERFSSYRPIVWVFSPSSSTVLFFSFFLSEGRQKKSAKEKIRYGVTQRIGIFAFVSERGPISYRADLPNILYNRDNKIPTAPFTINREKKYKVSFFSDTNFKLEFVEILSRMLTNLRD